jgi:hypothetical protein
MWMLVSVQCLSMASDPTVQAAPSEPLREEKPDWSGLWIRTQRSCVTTLDLARILLFDAIILFIGKAILYATDKWIQANDQFFKVAHQLSHGLFLLLYVTVAGFHVIEFIWDQRRR